MIKQKLKSIRPFIGAKDFQTSRNFYRDLGFEENILNPKLSVFLNGDLSFYLQDYYAKEWVDNTMVFVEVEDTDLFWEELQTLDITKYPDARLVPVRTETWGKECFVHDPSGVLWHFGHFYN
jgi:catechol 2,3-dioxygenase-like lactoylglutathione lyase family enzyme